MWTCLLQVRHSDHQAHHEDDEDDTENDEDDTEDNDSHCIVLSLWHGSEMAREMGTCKKLWGKKGQDQLRYETSGKILT